MATESANLTVEFERFAAPFVESGRYADSIEVLHAAMDAFRRAQAEEHAYDDACLRAAEEGEASGLAEGDIFQRARTKFGLKSRIPA